MLSAYWADPQVEAHERRNPIARTLERFNKWFNRMAIRYKGLIAWALDHRVAMVLIAIGSFIGALALPAVGLVGASFFGTEDQSEVNIAVETPPGSNLAYTRIKAEEAAAKKAEVAAQKAQAAADKEAAAAAKKADVAKKAEEAKQAVAAGLGALRTCTAPGFRMK